MKGSLSLLHTRLHILHKVPQLVSFLGNVTRHSEAWLCPAGSADVSSHRYRYIITSTAAKFCDWESVTSSCTEKESVDLGPRHGSAIKST
jgi:hypothetical protein